MAWLPTHRAPNGDVQLDPRERAIRNALLQDGIPMGRRLREMSWPRVLWEIVKALGRGFTREERPFWDSSEPPDAFTAEAYADAIEGEVPRGDEGHLLPWYRRLFARAPAGEAPPAVETYRGS